MAKRGRPPKKRPENTENAQNEPKNDQNTNKTEQNPEKQAEDNLKSKRPKQFMTPFEAADYFGVKEAAIKRWVTHGHLELTKGGLIPMASVKNCKFKVRKIL